VFFVVLLIFLGPMSMGIDPNSFERREQKKARIGLQSPRARTTARAPDQEKGGLYAEKPGPKEEAEDPPGSARRASAGWDERATPDDLYRFSRSAKA